jgi:hypothetical protein
MADQDIEIEVDMELEILSRLLADYPPFINLVRLAETKSARGKGNLYGKYAQRQKKPSAVQPNAQQRVW